MQENKTSLFGTIPPNVWRMAWEYLHSDDVMQQLCGMSFWVGVYTAASTDDPHFCDKLLLADTSLMLCLVDNDGYQKKGLGKCSP